MQQVTRYIVSELGVEQTNILSIKDRNLVDTFTLTSLPFYPTKNRVDVSFYDLNDLFIETIRDVKSYKVHGILQKDKANQIDVYPAEDAERYGYNGDVRLKYDFFNNLFSKDNTSEINLFVSEISTDRTELRAKCLSLSDVDLKAVVDSIYTKLNLQNYFSEIYLEFFDEGITATGVNIMTEVVDGEMYVTFKTYEPLPETVVEKSRFNVLERVGDPVKFEVIREVEVIEDPVKFLKKPNFNIDKEEQVVNTTDYLNFEQLFSFPVSGSHYTLQNLAGKESISIAIDYTDFKEFIHFSSADERLENFRYKMGLIESYENTIEMLEGNSVEIQKYRNLLNGVVANFDHYERYLYFESGSSAWPKQTSVRPYINVPESEVDQEWWDSMKEKAAIYDNTNQDILIGTIPFVLREDPRNEPYVIFVHMIGQHFDNEWVYAKALADKYKADNRLDFGISKDLVKEAVRDLGLKLYESNQNLAGVFEACNSDGTYDPGTEISVQEFKRITDESFPDSTEYQPMSQDLYRKEVYKRIYHNLPILLKAKGTERGLRALVNCFGIPDDILRIEVRGGVKTDSPDGYFGPMDSVTSSIQKVRLDCSGSLIPFMEISGSDVVYPVLHRDISTVDKHKLYSDDSHQVVFGFDLNSQVNNYLKSKLTSGGFDYDDIVGDPRNHGENYNDAFTKLRNQLLDEYEGSFRSPAAIIRLVRYFDSILFRSVKEFLPARSNVSVGAIVEDNILHRNRYKGATPTGSGHVEYVLDSSEGVVRQDQYQDQNLLISGSIKVVSATGSDSGHLIDNILPANRVPSSSFTLEGVDIERTGSVPVYELPWSIGRCTGSKPIFDDSPAYNGEFSGSQIEASDAEVMDNPYRRGGSSAMIYKVAAMMLDQPSPLVCDIILNLKNDSYIHKYFIQTSSFESDLISRNIPYEFKVSKTGSTILAESKSISLDCLSTASVSDRWFIGWTSGSTQLGSDYFSYGTLRPIIPPTEESDRFVREDFIPFNSGDNRDDCHTIVYGDITNLRERLRVQVANIVDYTGTDEHGYGYYGNGGLVVSYLIHSRYKTTDPVQWDAINSFDVEVLFDDNTSEIITVIPGKTTQYSMYEDCWGISVFVDINVERKNIVKYGVKSINVNVTGNSPEVKTHSFMYGNVFFDADWYYSYGESGSVGNWNYDNHHAETHGWDLVWLDTIFDWKWL